MLRLGLHSVAAETLLVGTALVESGGLRWLRQRGGGPRFIRISARCVKYRRVDLKAYADARLRSSTSDSGEAA